MKQAVLSMDVEDWYHLDYFDRSLCDKSFSMLDGLANYAELLRTYNIKTTFFVLGELVNESLRRELMQLSDEGHEIASHGWDHQRPLNMSTDAFQEDLIRSKCTLENAIQSEVHGYRAPCFSMDRKRLNIVRSTGYNYDSSRILCEAHPLYGNLGVSDFDRVTKDVYRRDGFYEFEVSSLPFMGRDIPVSGGGYLRIFPWISMKFLLRRYLHSNDLYFLYIHPFELSTMPGSCVPRGTSWATRCRFQRGRGSVKSKLEQLIILLKNEGFSFTTFASLRERFITSSGMP